MPDTIKYADQKNAFACLVNSSCFRSFEGDEFLQVVQNFGNVWKSNITSASSYDLDTPGFSKRFLYDVIVPHSPKVSLSYDVHAATHFASCAIVYSHAGTDPGKGTLEVLGQDFKILQLFQGSKDRKSKR